jgi:hypothetical protein
MAHDERIAHEDDLQDVSHIQNEDVSHEESDVKIRPIVMFMFWLTVAAIVIHLLMAGLYKVLDEREETAKGKDSPMAAERQVIPPEPRLQLAPTDKNQGSPRFIEDHPLNDIRKLRADEDAKMHSYEADPNTGTARIPIEDAKNLLLESGAMGQQTMAQPLVGDNRPSRSNSGRGASKPGQAESPAHQAPQH